MKNAVYGKRRNYRKKRVYKKRTAKRTGVSAGIRRYVKRTIHSQIENKIASKQDYNNTITSYTNNTSLLVLSMIPYANISQGVGQGDRIGNTIRTRKCMFNFVIRALPYSVGNPIPVPQDVLIFFGKVKNSRAQAPISSDFAKLFQLGDSVQSPQSRLLDNVLTINKDWFSVVKTLRFKIGYSAVTGTGANIGANYYANNEYKWNQTLKLDLTKYCPKIVKFNDTTAQPTNDGLWMWAMCNNADGSVNNFDPSPIYMDYNISYTYEDA